MATVGAPCPTAKGPCGTVGGSFGNYQSTLCHLQECRVLGARELCANFRSALCYFRKPCSKSFGERCALEDLLERVVSPNAAKSASLVKNVPCRPLCEGYFHQTILNNSMSTQKCIATLSQPLLSTSPSLYLPASVVRYFLMWHIGKSVRRNGKNRG